jgi:hypothetical protein
MVSNLTLFCLATFVGFDILFGNLFGYFSKNWAIFSKASGHPAPAEKFADLTTTRGSIDEDVLEAKSRNNKNLFLGPMS